MKYFRSLAVILPLSLAMCTRSNEPSLVGMNIDVMTWAYPGKYLQRNFKDERPFCSLDEVILREDSGRVVILNHGDEGFEEQEKDFKEEVLPHYLDCY